MTLDSPNTIALLVLLAAAAYAAFGHRLRPRANPPTPPARPAPGPRETLESLGLDTRARALGPDAMADDDLHAEFMRRRRDAVRRKQDAEELAAATAQIEGRLTPISSTLPAAPRAHPAADPGQAQAPTEVPKA